MSAGVILILFGILVIGFDLTWEDDRPEGYMPSVVGLGGIMFVVFGVIAFFVE